MSDFESWYAMLDNGTLTIGFACFCLLLTLAHLGCKIRLQNSVLQAILRFAVIITAFGITSYALPFFAGKAYATMAQKIANRPFASEQQLRQASDYFSRALANGYWNNALLRDYSVSLVRIGEGQMAVDVMNRGPWQAETDPELMVPLSRALLAAGNYERAIIIAGQAMQTTDEFTRFWAIRTIAEAYIADNRPQAAASFLENCLAGINDAATQELLKQRIIQIRQGKKWLETQ